MESRFASELTNFNGNYISRLEKQKLTEINIAQQLERLTKINCYQVGYIFCPSVSREDGTLLSSQLRPLQSTRFFANAFGIDSLQLICKNLTTEFDGLFQDLWIITIKELEILKKVLARMSTIVIFSNDAIEVETFCAKIKELMQPESSCFFILANSSEIDLSINANILAQIRTHTIEKDIHSFNFWREVRNQLSDLADLTPQTQSTQKCCIMM